MLRQAFGDRRLYPEAEGDTFVVDGVEFVCDYRPGSTADRFFIVKSPRAIPGFRQLCGQFKGSTIVELGIAEGGSVALLALEAVPRRLVALDLEPNRLGALDEFVTQRDLGDVVRLHYGVDQADRTSVLAALDDLDGEPIDLAIDDASHQLGPTRSSFDAIFPRVRPGGLFIIEDWCADHLFRAAIVESLRSGTPEVKAQFQEALKAAPSDSKPPAPDPSERPLCDIAVQLLLARASFTQVIEEVTINEFGVAVRRGPADVDPDTFRLADLVHDHLGYLPS